MSSLASIYYTGLMSKISIIFYGSQSYSLLVKHALIQADYPLTDQLKQADLMVVADYGRIIPAKEFTRLKFGGLNLHPSRLPAYRGATPVPRQILAGETKSAITIIKLAAGIDNGPIVAQEKLTILATDTSPDLLNRAFTLGAKLLIKTLPAYLNHKITLKPQPKKSPTPYAKKFTKADGFIPWMKVKQNLTRTDLVMERKIRALYPWPGVWTKLPNGKILKLLPKNMFQLEGKQPINFKQFKAGYL